MPGNVKTKRDEKMWKRAKKEAHKSYPDKSEDDDSFWAIVQTIYKRMKGVKEEEDLNYTNRLRYLSGLEKL